MANLRVSLSLIVVLFGVSLAKPSAGLDRKKRQADSCSREFHTWETFGSFNSSECVATYPNNALWTFKINTGVYSCNRVTIDFNVIDIEGPQDSCPYDKLQIVGQDEYFCGAGNAFTKEVTVQPGSPVEIRFSSDYSVTGQGFSFTYNVEAVSCNDVYGPTPSSSYGYPTPTPYAYPTYTSDYYYPTYTPDYSYPSYTSQYPYPSYTSSYYYYSSYPSEYSYPSYTSEYSYPSYTPDYSYPSYTPEYSYPSYTSSYYYSSYPSEYSYPSYTSEYSYPNYTPDYYTQTMEPYYPTATSYFDPIPTDTNFDVYTRLASLLNSLKSDARELANQLTEVLAAIEEAERQLAYNNDMYAIPYGK